jgi:hypothetical protein
MINRKKRIYVAGPYSKGDVAVNVKTAIDVGNQLADHGFAPYIPHFTHFWHMLHPRPYEFWLAHDNEFLPVCHALLRIPGDSSGGDAEVKLAESLNLPVFFTVEELLAHYDSTNGKD